MKSRSPWLWVPTLYFAEGIPYFVVNSISVILFKRMGMGNADMALWTSLLYFPWLIKPLWSPFVDVLRTKRWWILAMQLSISLLFAFLSFSLPSRTGAAVGAYSLTIVCFWITAFASSTHDIAIDGFYMLGLSGGEQSFFAGIRTTFYRLANLFVQGGMVVVAGVLEQRGDVPRAWKLTLLSLAIIWTVLTLYHLWAIPKPSEDRERESSGHILKEFGRSFSTFFAKKEIWAGIAFMLLFRLPEAFALKIVPAFLVDPSDSGGMGLDTVSFGIVNNTVGVIGIVLGGILGGISVSRRGLRKSLWPMALSLALPCAVYLWMAFDTSMPLWLIGASVGIEQFGYGFGFTAYTLYMIFLSDGPFKTSHYSLCTAFMAASMMLPGLVAGALQESLGYKSYFVLTLACSLATFAAVIIVRRKLPEDFGRK